MGKDGASGLDSILEQLGAFGKYNIVNYTFLLIPVYLAGIYSSVYIFEAQDLDYRCKVSECENTNQSLWLKYAIPKVKNKLSKCKRYALKSEYEGVDNFTCSKDIFSDITQNCDTIVYSDDDTIVRDFNLGCQDWKRTLVGTVRNSGLFISLPLTGVISDKFGRKLALSVAALMNGILGVIRSFSVNYYMTLVFEFLEASLGAGMYSTAFVMAMELVGPKGRVFGNTLINGMYVFGLITLASLWWWVQSWRIVLKILYGPSLILFSYFWIIDESIRWLLSKGRINEATAILNKAAKMNKVDLSEHVLAPLNQQEKNISSDVDNDKNNDNTVSVAEKSSSNFKDVIKSSIIRKRLIVCSFLWITCTFVYNGLSINSVSLAGNKYVNFMLVVFVEIPANIVCLLVLDRFGRKKVLIIDYVLSACLCISLSLLPHDLPLLSLLVYLSGKFFITVAYSSVYIYVSEVFPTSVRQSLLAICSSLGRIGSALAPQTPLLALYYTSLPAICFGSMALIASVLVFTLPETINAPLPDTIEEAEQLSNKKNRQMTNEA